MKKLLLITLILNGPASFAMEKIFSTIYQTNAWRDQDSYSGSGSNLKQTEIIRKELPQLFHKLKINFFIDAPCGDFFWMKEVNFHTSIKYLGVDIVPELIKRNNDIYATNDRHFEYANIVTDQLPNADLIFCRDCLVHLTFSDGIKAIQNMKKSGIKYLLATTFTRNTPNKDISKTGNWRPLNLQLHPYNLPKPLVIINEGCTEKNKQGSYEDKSLGLWLLESIDL